jgi:hypothetical protein
MVIVPMFIVLFLAMLGVVYREVAGALRIESLHSLQVSRDKGSVCALGRGLALLENGLPPTNPYECCATVNTPAGPRTFTVTFASVDGVTWQVSSSPASGGAASPPMPDYFGAPASAASADSQ